MSLIVFPAVVVLFAGAVYWLDIKDE